jgi:hypothetical protein
LLRERSGDVSSVSRGPDCPGYRARHALAGDRHGYLLPFVRYDNTAPEIAAAEHFWDRLVPGGIIVLDDYGWRKQINQKIAFDRFADARKINVLSLPTGQGC